ncbi:MAG: hypothetical protein QOI41_4665 [Myxococcales bacterium]|jgi:hypothetical protein|nr:hypothetical protein [Myxococcales bacterium]
MIPPLPPPRGPGQDGGTASIPPRYEDITQDGRIQLTAMMPGLGAAVWRALLAQVPAIEIFREQGILPILRRLAAVAEDRPVSVNGSIHYTGSFRFAREKDGDRLFANMWVEAHARVGTTNGPRPAKDAPRELLGRIFAEHVLTRPFAAPSERRVTRLDGPGLPPIPEDEHVFESAEALIASAGGPLEDSGDFPFGMMHTDSNQHVNSLVYPRVFEEAALRRLVHDTRIVNVPKPHELLARAVELRWRKPFFAGERATIGMRFAEGGGGGDGSPGARVAAVGAFYREDAPEKPSSAVKMLFR